MPIVVDPPAPIGAGVPQAPPSLRERWVWIDSHDHEFELTRFVNGIEVTKGMIGRGAPTVRVRREVVPGQPGQRTRSIAHDMREMTVPIAVMADSYDDLHARLRDLVSRMDPVSNGGVLRRIDRDNNTSDLYCCCVSGLGIAGEGSSGNRMFRALLIMQADDPYWYGPTLTRGFSGSASTSWFNWLPIQLGSSSVIGNVTITNDGDVDTYPTWTIIGPAADPEIINVTTGKTLAMEFPSAIDAGEKVVIDTRPFFKSVTFKPVTGDAENWRGYLTQRSLWPLVPGLNQIALSLGSTTADSYISIAYRKRTLYP